jgi:L-asparagine transporter-like permease
MKENKSYSELTLEELLTKKSKMKSIVIALSIVMLFIVVVLIYLALKSKNYTLIAVGIGCLITLLPGVVVLNQIDTEIKSRDLK